MNLTRKVVIASAIWFLIWMVFTIAYELWTIFNKIPNDTISHVVAIWTATHAWGPTAFVLFGGLFIIFWITVILHWWGPGFWWKPAQFIKGNIRKLRLKSVRLLNNIQRNNKN